MYSNSYLKKCKALIIDPLSLDDLVELCKEMPKHKKNTFLQLLSNFRIGVQRNYCDSYLKTQTLHDLWIMFYIFEKDGKIWNEGKNVWMD